MLIDTNIFVEIVRKQPHCLACSDLLNAINLDMIGEEVCLSRFSLNAIESMLSEATDFLREILLLIFQKKIKVINLSPEDDLMVNSMKKDLNLDFDDTVQFLAASKLGTYLVTYDKDFSRTSLQTKTPEDILKSLSAGE